MKKMMDGNEAAAHSAYACSEVAAIYPITPSSSMAEYADEWAVKGIKNIFDSTLKVTEMQSEAGAAGAVHGSLAGGALTTTFTASQGLLLMIPNMYKMAGELLPAVFHVSARTIATHALSIFGDHSDVMACRQTGFAMLASNSPQEAMDLALVSHMSAIKSSIPFLHFFDGFRTSHQINNVEVIDYKTIKELMPLNKINEFKKTALSPNSPHQQGTAQNPDIFFQNREACNKYYNKVPALVQESFDELYKKTGRRYNLFDYCGDKNAEQVIVIMGSGAETSEETIDYLNNNGKKLGLIKVRLCNPFDIKAFVASLPKTIKQIAVLDKTKESTSIGEPLYLNVISALVEMNRTDIKVVGGRYGLGGKDFTPGMVKAIFDNLSNENKNHFTIGINDDITNTSLNFDKYFSTENKEQINCKFYGLGGDGTVSANKNAIKIIGQQTDMHAQGFFEYDSKKSGSITISHLRFGKNSIKSTYKVNQAHFIACHNDNYLNKYDMLDSLKQNGTFLLNTEWTTKKELNKNLPNNIKIKLIEKNANFYTINAVKLAEQIGLKNKINTIMQSAFFYLTDIISYKKAQEQLKILAKKTYGKKGKAIVEMNNQAIMLAKNSLQKIDYTNEWSCLNPEKNKETSTNDYFNKFIKPILSLKGNNLPVSSFNAKGFIPTGTSKHEKRSIAKQTPVWLKDKCLQCNQCSFVCPHGAIKPILLTDEEAEKLPEEFVMVVAKGETKAKYRIQINPEDCTGCGSCANICPAQALVMKPADEVKEKELNNYNLSLTLNNMESRFNKNTVKGSQYKPAYFEFSGACAGCGETPYIKLVTQLFGDRMIIANATGCSSIYGASAPTCPYTKDINGKGPAWANSLFEDNAEFGLGIKLAYKARRETLINQIKQLITNKLQSSTLTKQLNTWLNNYNNTKITQNLFKELSKSLDQALAIETNTNNLENLTNIKNNLDLIIPKSMWIIGGDGWAYDIGYGGLDHVLASGENVNILVLDTEVYSNTGGQSSKASPAGSVAKFTAGGKQTRKKDLGLMAMTYKDVYVASVAMGGNMNQLVKALTEAEAYNGPSLILAYSTCINHGIDMSNGQKHMKEAVSAGYWNLYRYNPDLRLENKNPFILDSKNVNLEKYKDFIKTETRYASLEQKDKATAKKLFEKSKQDATDRMETYKTLAENK